MNKSYSRTKPKFLLVAFVATLLTLLAVAPMHALAQGSSELIEVPDGQVQLVDWSRLSGESRIDTMSAISNAGFESSDTVIVASAGNFPDALSATALAGYYQCPILLTNTDSLDLQTATEITRLKASNVIVVGGEAGVSQTAMSQIEGVSGVNSVERISGDNRFETSELIYEQGNKVGAWDKSETKTAIIASGTGFADALSMSPYAYANGAPIFLADASGSLTVETSKLIRDGKFDQAIVAGGEGVVSATTESYLKTMIGEDKVTRLSGGTRYDTSAKIVSWCIEQGMSYEGLAIASGENFPDALSGGALCGHRNSVAMLIGNQEGSYASVLQTLSQNKLTIKAANVLGGSAAVQKDIYQLLQEQTLAPTSATTGKDGKAFVANTNKVCTDIAITYADNGEVLPNSQVKANSDGTYDVALPEAAHGKSVKVTITDSVTGKAVDNLEVTATDSNGSIRSTQTTKDGVVSFVVNEIDFSKATVDTTDKTYNGKAQTTSVAIEGLVENTDYKVTYENNTDAGTAILTVEGIGTRTGSKIYTFKIKPADISQATVTLDDTVLTYNGDSKTQNIKSIVFGGFALEADTDYVVSRNSAVNAGDYELLIAGKGNYTGTVFETWTIKAAAIDYSNVTIDPASATYTGEAIEPEVKGLPEGLVINKDYTIDYVDNINAGNAEVIIAGMGNYDPKVTKEVSFVITAASLADAEIYLDSAEFTYDTTAKAPKAAKVLLNNKVLVEGEDYTVTSDSKTNVGDYKFTIEGTGNYKETASADWSIKSADAVLDDVVLDIPAKGYIYDSEAKEPKVKNMPEGIEYDIAYANNTNAGTATATITCKGNYTGTKAIEFTIAHASIEDADVTLDANELTYIKDTEQTKNVTKVTLDTKDLASTDYKVSGNTGTDAGDYSLVIEGTGNYTGTVTVDWTINPLEVTDFTGFSLETTNYTYDGEAKEPKVIGPDTYTQGVDYTVVYDNNTNATTDTSKAKATVTIVGNYIGSTDLEFEIAPASIESAELILDSTDLVYDGDEKTQKVAKVILGNKVLTADDEYIVAGNTDTEADDYELTVTGNGNYTGSVTAAWSIAPAELNFANVALNPDSYTYDGDEKEPTVKGLDGYTLDKDYTVTYANNTNAGTATATIEGKDNYTGTKVLEFTIAPASIEDADVTLDANELTYIKDTEQTKNVTKVTLDTKDLASTDYKVSGNTGTNADDYSLVVEGTGNYTGTVTVDWSIKPLEVTDFSGFNLEPTNYIYDGEAKEPKVTGPDTYTQGVDYTVAYDNNTNATTETSKAKATVTFDGNYTGSTDLEFTIAPASIKDAELILDSTDLVYDGDKKTQKVAKVILDNKVLTADDEYIVAGNTGKEADDYELTVTGNGNYTGSVTADWSIAPAELDFANVALDPDSYTYDGDEKEPTVKGLNDYDSDDYTVTYANNTNAGTATATIEGKDNYTGTKVLEFTIAPASIESALIVIENTEDGYITTYSGSEQEVDAIVTLGNKALVEDTDYTVVSGDKGTDVDTYTYTIEGTGNYTGTATANWKICPLSIEGGSYELDPATYTYNEQEQTVGVKTVKTADGSKTLEAGDYELSGDTTGTNAGTYKFKIIGVGNYTGTISDIQWTIDPLSIKDEGKVELDPTELVYDGSEQTQKVNKVILDNKILDATTDYTVTGNKQTNVKVKDSSVEGDTDSYTLTVTGAGNYEGSVDVDWNILPKDISGVNLTLDKSSYVYDGEKHLPTATVTDSAIQVEGADKTLVENTDFTVPSTVTEQSENGTYTYTIEGKGNYKGSKSEDWTITAQEADLTDLSLEAQAEDFYTYNGKEKKPGVTGFPEGMNENKDYTVTYTNNVEAGIGIVRVVCIGNYTGDATLTFQIDPKDISGTDTTVELNETDLVYKEEDYKAVEQTNGVKSVTVTGITDPLTSETDYTVGGTTSGKYAGDYELTVTGKGNYTGTKTVKWTIAKADYSESDLPSNVTATGYVGNTLADVTLTTDKRGWLVWNDKTESLGTNVTTVEKKATFVPYYYDNYNTKEITVKVEVKDKSYTIVYHGNSATSCGTSSDGEYTYTQDVTSALATVTLEANKFAKTEDTTAYTMTGWNTQADGMGTSYSDQASIETTDSLVAGVQNNGTVDLYAQWLTSEVGSYWIAPAMKSTTSSDAPEANASYTSPTEGVVRTQSLIDEDMKVLHYQIDSNSLGQGRDTIASIYQSYSDSDAYHLYTAWKGDDTAESENKYVEFRIIQVGEHDWDGSVVTFMATHSLPTKKSINLSRVVSDGGWGSSNMRTSVIPNYVAGGLGDLANAAKTITKRTMSGKAGEWVLNSTVKDSIWLMSYSEIYGEDGIIIDETYGEGFAKEGSQYEWFANKVTNSGFGGVNPAISGIDLTRNGSAVNPTNCPQWYLRTFSQLQYDEDIVKASMCGFVTTSGEPSFDDGSYNLGVVPCFAF